MFRYKAVNERNEIVEGDLEASSEQEVFEQLHRRGLFPVEAARRGAGSMADFLPTGLFTPAGVTAKDVTLLTRQLAALLQARIEIERALGILISMSKKPAVQQALTRVRDAIRGGQTVTDAFSGNLPKLPSYYTGMVRAGELGGSLELSFERLGAFLKKSQDTRDAVTSKLVYPAILVFTAGLSLVMLVAVVLPQFEPIFRDAGQELPLVIGLLLWIAEFVGGFWWLLLGLGIAAVLFARLQLRRPSVRQSVDAWLLRAPVVGTIVLRVSASRFCRTLGTLLTNGVPVASALPSAIAAVGNRAMAVELSAVTERVKQGSGLSSALVAAEHFPDLARQLVAIGEESGRLDQMLVQAADLYDQETEQRIQRLVTMLTPTLTIVLGAVVAVIISSILTAVLSLNEITL